MDTHIFELLGAGLRESAAMFWQTLWALILGFSLSGAVQAFVSRREMRHLLGGDGVGSLLRATGFGAASSSCSYASAAMAKSLFAGGAGFLTAMVFMVASTNLVIELGIVLAVLIGWQFTVAELFGGLLMIGMFVVVGRLTLSRTLVAAARERLRATSDRSDAAPEVLTASPPLSVRLRSVTRWRAAAGYALADLRMLRKELVAGFLVAGFLAALVPAEAWRTLFISGHGFASSLENAVIGPLIAMLSFVCSVGNVPLAAALWKGGISFGGVASFLYADLITFPLLLIYRRYYGGRLTLRLVGTFWLVMSAAGLITQYLFKALGAIPASRPHQIALHALGWNLTSGLDVIALLLLGAGLLLIRRGADALPGEFAKDPVCGMQVERTTAPIRLRHQGEEFFFCSEDCRDRFQRHPDRFGALGSEPMETPSTTTQIDPVCGMPVAPRSPLAPVEFQGRQFRFCSPQCRVRFEADPARFGQDLPTQAAGQAASAIDPVCGMEVDPSSATAESIFENRRFYFCSVSCHDRFLQAPDRFSALHTLELPATQAQLPIDPICGMSVDPASPGATLELPEGTMYFCCQPCADEYAAAGTASL